MLLVLLLALLLPQAAAQEVPVASTIEAATVFQRGAQVTRTASARVPAGTSALTFTGLTPHLDPERVQLEAEGAFTILSIVHRHNFLPDSARVEIPAPLRTRRTVLQDSIRTVEAQLEVYQEEESLLLQNKSLGGDDGVRVDDLRAAADFFRTRLTDIKTRQLALRETLDRLRAALALVDAQIAERTDAPRDRTTSEITVTVSAPAATRGTFELRYVTPSAGWTPQYDVRVQDTDRPITLVYNANVYQSTGEDWNDIRLTLSTGDPGRPGTRPLLQPWYLGFFRPPPPPAYPRGAASRVLPGPPVANPSEVRGRVTDLNTGIPLPGVNVVAVGTGAGTATDADGTYRLALPPGAHTLQVVYVGYQGIHAPITSDRIDFMLGEEMVELGEIAVAAEAPGRRRNDVQMEEAAVATAQQVIQPTTVSFVIDYPSDVPSDGKPYLVRIEQYEVPATYAYYTAPKLDPSAFLTAHLTGWESLNLLRGQANLFLGGTFVGQSFLDVANVDDTLTVSLGRDESIVVRRTRQEAFTKRQFFGARQTRTVAFNIEVRNTKRQPVRIVVEDQVPRSTDDRIDVDLEDAGRATFDETMGLLRWRLDVPPAATETVGFRYEVTYPKDQRLTLE